MEGYRQQSAAYLILTLATCSCLLAVAANGEPAPAGLFSSKRLSEVRNIFGAGKGKQRARPMAGGNESAEHGSNLRELNRRLCQLAPEQQVPEELVHETKALLRRREAKILNELANGLGIDVEMIASANDLLLVEKLDESLELCSLNATRKLAWLKRQAELVDDEQSPRGPCNKIQILLDHYKRGRLNRCPGAYMDSFEGLLADFRQLFERVTAALGPIVRQLARLGPGQEFDRLELLEKSPVRNPAADRLLSDRDLLFQGALEAQGQTGHFETDIWDPASKLNADEILRRFLLEPCGRFSRAFDQVFESANFDRPTWLLNQTDGALPGPNRSMSSQFIFAWLLYDTCGSIHLADHEWLSIEERVSDDMLAALAQAVGPYRLAHKMTPDYL